MTEAQYRKGSNELRQAWWNYTNSKPTTHPSLPDFAAGFNSAKEIYEKTNQTPEEKPCLAHNENCEQTAWHVTTIAAS